MRAYWILCSLTVYVAGCCAGQCVADDGLSDARARLELIEKQRQQAEEIAKQAAKTTSADSAEELANDTPLPPSADVLPIADPISTPPVVTFSTVVKSGGSDGLVRSQATVTEYWLVSEPWCKNCEGAKKRFLENGRPESNIITIAEARARHGKVIGGIPFEYSTSEVREVVNPPTYRSQNIMVWGLNSRDFKPARETILAHLRGGDQHRGKHWQSWHLESWRTPQLYALHDDDHTGSVPTFEAESEVIATVSGGDSSPETFAAVLAAHLMEVSGQETDDSPIVVGGLFDFTISVEDSWKQLARSILSRQSIEFPKAGLSVDWSGAERSFSINKNAITIQPPVKMTVNKWVFRYSVGLRAVAFADDLSYVRLDLSGAPDVTIRLVGQ